MVEQTRNVENFLFCIAHDTHPIHHSVAVRNYSVRAETNISNKMRNTGRVKRDKNKIINQIDSPIQVKSHSPTKTH